MNKIHAVLALSLVALSTGVLAQETDASRQERMDAAYADSHHDTRTAGETLRDDTHRAGHAIHNGVRATGHAIHRGVRATGHAIHRGVDKITGK
jgi:hypothetical protein